MRFPAKRSKARSTPGGVREMPRFLVSCILVRRKWHLARLTARFQYSSSWLLAFCESEVEYEFCLSCFERCDTEQTPTMTLSGPSTSNVPQGIRNFRLLKKVGQGTYGAYVREHFL